MADFPIDGKRQPDVVPVSFERKEQAIAFLQPKLVSFSGQSLPKLGTLMPSSATRLPPQQELQASSTLSSSEITTLQGLAKRFSSGELKL